MRKTEEKRIQELEAEGMSRSDAQGVYDAEQMARAGKKGYGLVDGEYVPTPRIQDAMSKLLAAQGFTQMSQDVLGESDNERLRHYARIVVKNTPDSAAKIQLISNFKILRLI